MGYKMKLYFQTNPYFTNMVIVKEFQRSCSGRLVSHSTPIRWHRGQEPQNQDPQDHKPKNQRVKRSFFSWFSNHSLPEADSIAEVIKNDLWVNPVRYYMMGEEGYRANRKKQEKRKRLLHSKYQKGYDMLFLEDHEDYHIMKDIINSSSDSDMTDFETIHDIKISDFMETTDNEITETDSENLCDSKSPDYENRIMIPNDDSHPESSKIDNESFDDETTDDEGPSDFNEKPRDDNNDNKENPDDSENYSDSSNDDNHPIGNMKPKGGNLSSCRSNQWQQQLQQPATSSDSDSDSGDNEDSDEGNDGNEGDNESSDDDDDDDRDFEDSEDNDEDSDKYRANCNGQNDYMDEAENFLESSVEDEYQDSEEGSKQEDEIDEEEGRYEDVFEEIESEDDPEDSNIEGVLLVQNTWMNRGKNSGKTI